MSVTITASIDAVGFVPCLVRAPGAAGGGLIRVARRLLDAYVELVTARARWSLRLEVLFSIIEKDPVDVTRTDVLPFIKVQREPRHSATVVRIEGEQGWSARTIKRRLATIAGLYGYLIIRGAHGGGPEPGAAGWPCVARDDQPGGASEPCFPNIARGHRP